MWASVAGIRLTKETIQPMSVAAAAGFTMKATVLLSIVLLRLRISAAKGWGSGL